MNLSKKQREELRMMFGGFCAYCGCELPEKGWHADHVKPVNYDLKYKPGEWKDGKYTPSRFVKNGRLLRPENDILENIVPACRACNIDKGASELEDWRGWLQDRMIGNLRQYIANFRHAERFGRVTVTTGPLVFWFEQYRASRGEKENDGN